MMNVLAALKVAAFLLFVLAGLAFGTGSFSNVTASARHRGDGQLAVCLHPGDAGLLGVERVGVCRRRDQ